MSIRDAMLAPQESVSINEALGRICAAPTVSCPPAVPILMSGEVVDEAALRLLRFYGVDRLDVVK
jgi:arginine/lysine/ornithine decarboxylase